MKGKTAPILITGIVIGVIIVGIIAWVSFDGEETNTVTTNTNKVINTVTNSGNTGGSGGGPAISFPDCVSFGGIIQESYPRKCILDGVETFTEDIGNELVKTDLIKISSPRPNDTLTSPVTITGQARGTWFFEGSFAIQLKDVLGEEIGTAIATSTSDWMTEDFIPFSATLTFDEPAYGQGTLYLNKSNPSDNVDLSDQLIVPVDFPLE